MPDRYVIIHRPPKRPPCIGCGKRPARREGYCSGTCQRAAYYADQDAARPAVQAELAERAARRTLAERKRLVDSLYPEE
jgi:hypothetical protein